MSAATASSDVGPARAPPNRRLVAVLSCFEHLLKAANPEAMKLGTHSNALEL